MRHQKNEPESEHPVNQTDKYTQNRAKQKCVRSILRLYPWFIPEWQGQTNPWVNCIMEVTTFESLNELYYYNYYYHLSNQNSFCKFSSRERFETERKNQTAKLFEAISNTFSDSPFVDMIISSCACKILSSKIKTILLLNKSFWFACSISS